MNKFLSQIEKAAQDATGGDAMKIHRLGRSIYEADYARSKGQESNRGYGSSVWNDLKGEARAGLRSTVQGTIGGAALGGAAMALTKGHTGATAVAGLAGYLGGAVHGAYKSYKNQANEIHAKYDDHEKKAALEALLNDGYSFDTAVQAIEKEAGIFGAAAKTARMMGGKARTFGTAMKGDAGKVGAQFTALRTGKTQLQGGRFTTPVSISRGAAAKELVQNKAIQGAAGAAAIGGGIGAAMAGSTRQQEKRACLDKLLADGVNFDQAIELVKQAEKQVYGE
jgi:outer membrane lipoprotein SlyB